MINILFISIFFLTIPSILFTTEIDSFTQRYEDIRDSHDYLNLKTQELIADAVSKTTHCDRPSLFEHLRKNLGGSLWGNLENIINYLEQNWNEKEVRDFIKRLNKAISLISVRPNLFQLSEKIKI